MGDVSGACDRAMRRLPKGIGGHARPNQGACVEWMTPPEILSALEPFDDHPATPGKVDGLKRNWRGFVWLNPPYTPALGLWLERLADHDSGGIALLFARTETRIFWDWVWNRASALLFLKGRPHFYRNGIRAKGNSGGPMVLVGYGAEAMHRLRNCSLAGSYVTAWKLFL